MNKTLKPFKIIRPGETLKWALDNRGWTQKELAEIMNRPVQVINEIITGKKRITAETARELAAAFGSSSEFWLNLECNYQLAQSAKPVDEGEIANRGKLSLWGYKELIKRNWIREGKTLSDQVKKLCSFLGLPSLDTEPAIEARFKLSSIQNPNENLLYAWFRRVSQLISSMEVNRYSKTLLKKYLPSLLGLSVELDDSRKVSQIMQKMGIKLIFVNHLPKTYLDGAAFFQDNYGVIALTLRYKTMDCFWFTLLHELAHLFLAHKGIFLDDLDEDNENIEEADANKVASDWLISADSYQLFIKNLDPVWIKESQILEFAEKINRHPGIVVGRLQHDGLLSYKTRLNSYKVNIYDLFEEIIDKPA